jgi:hypothetical protein
MGKLDLDPVTMILLVVVAIVLLKPDLLSSLFGKRPAGAGAGMPGGYILTPPPSGGINDPNSAGAWRAAGMGDGSGRNAANPEMPTNWKPGQPIWNQIDSGTPAVEAFNREHPCPAGQQFNTFSQQCQTLGGWQTVATPLSQPPQSVPSPPAAVFEVKSSNYRDAHFTPFTGA